MTRLVRLVSELVLVRLSDLLSGSSPPEPTNRSTSKEKRTDTQRRSVKGLKRTARAWLRVPHSTKESHTPDGCSGVFGKVLAIVLIALFLLLILSSFGCSRQRIVGPSLSASSVQTLSSSAEILTELQAGGQFSASSNVQRPTKQSIFRHSLVWERLCSLLQASSSHQQSSDSPERGDN